MKKMMPMLICLFVTTSVFGAENCPVPYSEFEKNIAHIDLAECPRNKPDSDKGFCRLVMDGQNGFIYVFHYAKDEPCLTSIKKAKRSDYLMQK